MTPDGRRAASDPPGPLLLVVRHGQTEWSRSGRHTGLTDLPLTEEGEAQARALRARLAGRHFALVLTSPLQRAVDTARLAGLEGHRADPDLVEWDYGDFEGLTTNEIQRSSPGWTIWTGPWPHGELPAQVAARADRVVARIRTEVAPGESAVAVAHGHLLRVLAARWLGAPPETGRWLGAATASVSRLGWERATPIVDHWNDTSHLGDTW
jgi:probable phosphoglycerate mutase